MSKNSKTTVSRNEESHPDHVETVGLTLRLPRGVWRALKVCSMDQRRTMTEIILESIDRYLKSLPQSETGEIAAEHSAA